MPERKLEFLNIPSSIPKNDLIWPEYGKPFDEYLGVSAIANFSHGRGGKFQCTELIHRYLREVFSIPTRIGMGLGHAKELVKNLSHRFDTNFPANKYSNGNRVRFVRFENGCTIYPPMAGSVISFSGGKFGHAAIIRKINLESDRATVFLFEQHGSLPFRVGQVKPIRHFSFKKTNKFWSAEDVIDWWSPAID